ncbi:MULTISPECIES: c-type cytochrome biogenesis protein CcmI [Ferrimonas]|uniref:c-type cytochrome biogenesis protein CcmI n=1 Tax=Ferrimonas TaxID=44011 RepID=UPI0004882E59|nr:MULTISPECIES: c-type cytochrome biogenesis protein CcmI [Ferrimonas]USD37872.1 c-type cytochrome biogenesis protein CcmI [Ferrimonas sp. SCSIO 43195]
MTTFWIGIAGLTALALLLVWLPFFRSKAKGAQQTELRKQTNVKLFNERIAEFEVEMQEGRLTQQEFDVLKQEQELNLLQDVNDSNDSDIVNDRRGPLWPIILSVAVVTISGYTYLDLGRFDEWQNARPEAEAQANPHQGMTPEQMQQMRISQLEGTVMNEPNNSQAWFSLGHAYISGSQYEKAIAAFDTTIDLVGEHAELLGPKATAMYYLAGEKMTPEIDAIIKKALESDFKDPSTRLLLGMDAFFSANYEDAIRHWEILLTSPRDDFDRQAIQGAIMQAKSFLGTDSVDNPELNQDVEARANSVRVSISVSDEMLAKADANANVLVMARPLNGGMMPVAIKRLKVSDLPTLVVLRDSDAMTPEMVLSGQEQVAIEVVINHDSNPAPTPGDLLGKHDAVKLGSEVQVVIDTLVQ